MPHAHNIGPALLFRSEEHDDGSATYKDPHFDDGIVITLPKRIMLMMKNPNSLEVTLASPILRLEEHNEILRQREKDRLDLAAFREEAGA